MRDERKTVLLVRFVAVDGKFNRRSGVMGIKRGGGSAAHEIVKSTSEVIKDFSTAHRGTKRSRILDYVDRNVRDKTHHCAVDSASNELVACEIQRKPLVDAISPILPNCNAAVRDATHASRRILSRPWGIDEHLKKCVEMMARSRHSPARMIQCSLDLQVRFKDAVKKMHPQMRTPMSNLCAAKHRFETFAKPLGRSCYVFTAIVDVMIDVAGKPNGGSKDTDPRQMARQWLRWITATPCN
eukprot:8348896-Pyramimonas_sp.AAC.1